MQKVMNKTLLYQSKTSLLTNINEDYNVFICLKITNLLYPHLRIAGE